MGSSLLLIHSLVDAFAVTKYLVAGECGYRAAIAELAAEMVEGLTATGPPKGMTDVAPAAPAELR